MDYSRSELLQYTLTQNNHEGNAGEDYHRDKAVVTPELNKKNNVLHVKQLSADSSSTRMKYNFSSSPNLRPKSVTSLVSSPRSSPSTPTSTRRRPPPLPPSTSTKTTSMSTPYFSPDSSSEDDDSDHDDGGILEIKAISRSKLTSNNNSAPNLFSKPSAPTHSSTLGQRRITSPPNPKLLTFSSSPLLEKKSTSMDEATALSTPTSIDDCKSLDHRTVSKPPPRRAPPDPPQSQPPIPSHPVEHTSNTNAYSGHRHFSQRHTFSKQASTGSLRNYPETKRRGSSPNTSSHTLSQKPVEKRILSPPNNGGVRTLPPGVLFTPPPSRSQSLKRFATSSQRRPASTDKKAAPLTSALTAPTKPLPLLPSLSKPLPPLPSSDNAQLSTSVESDYAYIPDSPSHVTTTATMATKTNVAVKQPPSFDTDDYVCMSNNHSEIDGSTTRKPSQIGYGDDEYMSMSSNLDYSSKTRSSNSENHGIVDSSLSEVFKDEGAELSDEYMPMYPLTSQQISTSRNELISSDDYSQIIVEDEYVKMSSADEIGEIPVKIGGTPSVVKPASKMPAPNKPSSNKYTASSDINTEPLFSYTSMYIDLDMVRASLILSQQDNEAKHPKSRFSISTTELSSSEKNELQSKKSPEGTSATTSPDSVQHNKAGSSHQSTTSLSQSSTEGTTYHQAPPNRILQTHTSPHHVPFRSKVVPLPNIDESSGIYASISDTV